MASSPKAEPQWVALQKRVFGRWWNQKLMMRRLNLKDVVKDMTGEILMNLVEVTCPEKKFATKYGKLTPNPKMEIHKIDNANRALKFATDCGLQMEVKTSAENIVHGDEKEVMGLVWMCIRTFTKIDIDVGTKNVMAALLRWVQNQTAGYAHVNVQDFSQKSWSSGMALCALIHHFRPNLIGNYDALNPANKLENVKKAFKAAKEFFGLEEYLTPDEFWFLDEKAMFVYVAEYYTGINGLLKYDLAAKRIAKLMKQQQDLDALKQEYTKRAQHFRELLDKATQEIFTPGPAKAKSLAEAEKRLNDFYDYQTQGKNQLLDEFQSLENLHTQLQTKLANNHRPQFVPPAGLALKDLGAAWLPLEKREQELLAALRNELARQKEMLVLNDLHAAKYNKLKQWMDPTIAALQTKEEVPSSNAAEFQLNRLEATNKDVSGQRKGLYEELLAIGRKLAADEYENMAEVNGREQEIGNGFKQCDQLAAGKEATLKDDVARETLKEKISMVENDDDSLFKIIKAWIEEKEAYLSSREPNESVRDARIALGGLSLYLKARSDLDPKLAKFKRLGQTIKQAKHESQYSTWVSPQLETIKERETFVDEKINLLGQLYKEKSALVKDDLAREEFKEKLALDTQQQLTSFESIKSWVTDKQAYLERSEEIKSEQMARLAIGALESFSHEFDDMKGALDSFKKLTELVVTSKYATQYSHAECPNPDEVQQRLTFIEQSMQTLTQQAATKKEALSAALSQEKAKEQVRVQFAMATADCLRFTKLALDDLCLRNFGQNLQQVEAYAGTLAEQAKTFNAEVQENRTAIAQASAAMSAAGVSENPYTSTSSEECEKLLTEVIDGVGATQAAYELELHTMRANDQLLAKFATLAQAFVDKIQAAKNETATSALPLAEQLPLLEQRIQDAESNEGAGRAEIADIAAQIAEKKIRDNPHTLLTTKDVEVNWKQYLDFLARKKQTIQDELANKQGRGLTAQQREEISKLFKAYDANNSNTLDADEFKHCLYSLGVDVDQTKAKAIMRQYGGAEDKIGYAGFTEFMVHQLGDVDTKDAILESFQALAKGRDCCDEAVLAQMFSPADVAFFKSKAKQNPDGTYDYRAFCEAMYSS